MSEVESFTHNGREVTIYHDQEPMDPRDADHLGIMLANGHRRYTLGDEPFMKGKHSEYDDAARALEYYAERGKIRLFPRWLSIHLGSTVVLALGLYDHSGISMYVADAWTTTGDASNQFDPGGWDSGLVGFIFDTADTRETCGTALEHIEKALRAEVEIYDQYLTGDVYGYLIGGLNDEEDSCWGFFGLEYAKQMARDAAGYTCKHCEQEIKRWVGSVIDDQPEGDEHGFVHTCCKTCLRDIKWGGDGWYHHTVNPWDWPGGKPDHTPEITHRHACFPNMDTHAETDQEVGKYS